MFRDIFYDKQTQVIIQFICLEEIRLRLLGKNSLCMGIITILSSLLTSAVPPITQSLPCLLNEGNKYIAILHGIQNEIYRVKLLASIVGGHSYSEYAEALYLEMGLIIIALEVEFLGDIKIFVNPYQYYFEFADYYAYVIDKKRPS